MIKHLGDFLRRNADVAPANEAVADGRGSISNAELVDLVERFAAGLLQSGTQTGDRVAVFLDKQREVVVAILGCLLARCAFVPVNPVLKSRQVHHILSDSGARLLVTSRARWNSLDAPPPTLETVILVDRNAPVDAPRERDWCAWLDCDPNVGRTAGDKALETDLAAIFYTSGSTGRPKGVAVTNRNLVVGATSVAQYLENSPQDTILACLPLSFDAGFSQISTALASGAKVVLHNYLLAKDVPRACAAHGVTGLTAVPPLWFQLLQTQWPDHARAHLRYFANTGGHMPKPTLSRLRELFPKATPYLMYGLTEAFRSTYLPPSEVDRRPDSIGKAIPNAEIRVVRPDGSSCEPHEVGELVHRGPLVACGYWNDPKRTAERFRSAPDLQPGSGITEVAVWSGDMVRTDEDGFLYFVGRRDDMIKTMGYRVSPTEIEEIALGDPSVSEAAAFGVPHPTMGQAVFLVVVGDEHSQPDCQAITSAIRHKLPSYMAPACVFALDSLPHSPNGKIDRRRLSEDYRDSFTRTADTDASGT